mgnify:CR=1 FL=1
MYTRKRYPQFEVVIEYSLYFLRDLYLGDIQDAKKHLKIVIDNIKYLLQIHESFYYKDKHRCRSFIKTYLERLKNFKYLEYTQVINLIVNLFLDLFFLADEIDYAQAVHNKYKYKLELLEALLNYLRPKYPHGIPLEEIEKGYRSLIHASEDEDISEELETLLGLLEQYGVLEKLDEGLYMLRYGRKRVRCSFQFKEH